MKHKDSFIQLQGKQFYVDQKQHDVIGVSCHRVATVQTAPGLSAEKWNYQVVLSDDRGFRATQYIIPTRCPLLDFSNGLWKNEPLLKAFLQFFNRYRYRKLRNIYCIGTITIGDKTSYWDENRHLVNPSILDGSIYNLYIGRSGVSKKYTIAAVGVSSADEVEGLDGSYPPLDEARILSAKSGQGGTDPLEIGFLEHHDECCCSP